MCKPLMFVVDLLGLLQILVLCEYGSPNQGNYCCSTILVIKVVLSKGGLFVNRDGE